MPGVTPMVLNDGRMHTVAGTPASPITLTIVDPGISGVQYSPNSLDFDSAAQPLPVPFTVTSTIYIAGERALVEAKS